MRKFLCLALAASMATIPALAEPLDRFGKKAPRRVGKDRIREAPPRERSRGNAGSGESFVDSLERGIAESIGDLLLYGVVGGVLYGGTASWARVAREAPREPGNGEDEAPKDSSIEVAHRRAGEALIPFARLDAAYQFVSGDTSALDLRAEAGYAMAAVQVRRTDYREKEPKQDLATTGIHALYRMSFGSHFEMDIGLGALVLQRGGEAHSGVSFTLPFLVHPSDHYGIEVRPAWSEAGGGTIRDYDVALLGGWRHVSARAGYRWVGGAVGRRDGPDVGVSVRW